jgi:hypothetical protein
MDNKQINRDWTIREDRIPRRKDVVIDPEGNLGIVVKTSGDFSGRSLYVEDVKGQEVYSGEDSSHFRIANVDQTKKFYLSYKNNLGWIKNRIYTIREKDYPLQLVEMDYDLVKQEMFYVFRDLNVPEQKFLKTLNESLVEKIPEWYYETAAIFSSEDLNSSFACSIKIEIEETESNVEGWTVTGSELYFSSKILAEMEIKKWRDRLKIRRFASVFSMTEKRKEAIVSLGEDGFLFVSEFTNRNGQPAVFNSRVDAAVAMITIGEHAWVNVLNIEIDRYDI